MNNFVLEIWDDECRKCKFYSVRWTDSDISETDKFFKKYYAIPELKEPIQELLSFVLDSIGNDHVGEVTFLYPNFPLRLYALRIKERHDVVVLFNGGIKSGQTNQQSKGLHLKWLEACQFARRIDQAIRDKEIFLDKKGWIRSENGDSEILL
jgi:hypothetical protein